MKDFRIISETVFSVGITRKEYAKILHISSSSLYRYLIGLQKVTTKCLERAILVNGVVTKGISTFIDKQEFSRWLYKRNIALGSKPIDLLSTEPGIKNVDTILNRIEYGIFS